MMSNINQLRADLDRYIEEAKVAGAKMQEAQIALAVACCPFTVGQTIKTMWRNRETPAVVDAILPGWQISAPLRKNHAWKLRIVPINKNGKRSFPASLSWSDNRKLLDINGISGEEIDYAD